MTILAYSSPKYFLKRRYFENLLPLLIGHRFTGTAIAVTLGIQPPATDPGCSHSYAQETHQHHRHHRKRLLHVSVRHGNTDLGASVQVLPETQAAIPLLWAPRNQTGQPRPAGSKTTLRVPVSLLSPGPGESAASDFVFFLSYESSCDGIEGTRSGRKGTERGGEEVPGRFRQERASPQPACARVRTGAHAAVWGQLPERGVKHQPFSAQMGSF